MLVTTFYWICHHFVNINSHVANSVNNESTSSKFLYPNAFGNRRFYRIRRIKSTNKDFLFVLNGLLSKGPVSKTNSSYHWLISSFESFDMTHMIWLISHFIREWFLNRWEQTKNIIFITIALQRKKCGDRTVVFLQILFWNLFKNFLIKTWFVIDLL